MSIVDDPRTERVVVTAGSSIARVLDDRQRHAVNLALQVCSYVVAAFPPDSAMTPVEVVRLLRRFAESCGVEDDDGDD
jgi:hypothetical protein